MAYNPQFAAVSSGNREQPSFFRGFMAAPPPPVAQHIDDAPYHCATGLLYRCQHQVNPPVAYPGGQQHPPHITGQPRINRAPGKNVPHTIPGNDSIMTAFNNERGGIPVTFELGSSGGFCSPACCSPSSYSPPPLKNLLRDAAGLAHKFGLTSCPPHSPEDDAPPGSCCQQLEPTQHPPDCPCALCYTQNWWQWYYISQYFYYLYSVLPREEAERREAEAGETETATSEEGTPRKRRLSEADFKELVTSKKGKIPQDAIKKLESGKLKDKLIELQKQNKLDTPQLQNLLKKVSSLKEEGGPPRDELGVPLGGPRRGDQRQTKKTTELPRRKIVVLPGRERRKAAAQRKAAEAEKAQRPLVFRKYERHFDKKKSDEDPMEKYALRLSRRVLALKELEARPYYHYELPTINRLISSLIPEMFNPPTLSTTHRYHLVKNAAVDEGALKAETEAGQAGPTAGGGFVDQELNRRMSTVSAGAGEAAASAFTSPSTIPP